MKISYKTDVGNVREVNEDSLIVEQNSLSHTLCAVADGMGGHNAGEVASALAIDVVKKEFEKAQYTNINEFLKQVISKANTLIYTTSLIDESYSKMGTTLSIVILTNKTIHIGHIGDSRVYYFNSQIGKSVQLTKDHTMVQMLYEQGHLKKEELDTHPYKNVLAQSLGTSKVIKADIQEVKLPNKGYVLLCSDGLTDDLPDKDIYQIVTDSDKVEQKTQVLVNQSLKKEGKDNITVILIER